MHIDINYLCACLACSIAILFIHALWWEGNILAPVHSLLENHRFNVWIRKPIYLCLICMGPWYSFAFHFIFISPEIDIPFILCVSGINVIFDTLILPARLKEDG
jgi:hypothetical protein